MSDNEPFSEQYRQAALAWADLDSAATLLEETKSAVLSQMMVRWGDIPVSHAERNVKSSDEWVRFVTKMVEARTAANKAKINADYIKMRYWEQSGEEATKRAEMRL